MAEKVGGTWNFGKRGKYPWDEWSNGEVWKIRHGIDFHTADIHNMRAALTAAATRLGMKVRTHMDEEDRGILYFQMYVPEEG